MTPHQVNWKDAGSVEQWRRARREQLETRMQENVFLERSARIAAEAAARVRLYGSEGRAAEAHRIFCGLRSDEAEEHKHQRRAWSVPRLLKNSGEQYTASNSWSSLVMQYADAGFVVKGYKLAEYGLESKGNRQIACQFLASEVHCTQGHHFSVLYQCGNRYCANCGPLRSQQTFARVIGPLKAAAARLLDCGDPHCKQCYQWRRVARLTPKKKVKSDDGFKKTKKRIEGGAGPRFAFGDPVLEQQATEKRMRCIEDGLNSIDAQLAELSTPIEVPTDLPHWPPVMHGPHPSRVVAIFDFTLRNENETDPWILRSGFRLFNGWIKKFFRLLERRYGIDRRAYGFLFCDELGGNNSNIHAHGVYVGPWLSQVPDHCEQCGASLHSSICRKCKHRHEPILSKLWDEVTGGMGRIVFIRCRDKKNNYISIERALYHAMKYPAKFAVKAKPERLAFLEVVFHKVRRIHAFASFYNLARNDDDSIQLGKCAVCNQPVSIPEFRYLRADLEARGLPNLLAIQREIAKHRALSGVPRGSP